MLWKLNGKLMKTPSTYKDNIEDTDNDSYTSKVTGALIDNPIAIGMLKLEMSWDYLSEDEAEELLQAIQMLDSTLDMDCKLYLYGLDWEGNIQQKIQQYGLTNRVVFAGWIEGKEKQEALENAMLSVLPSHYEALSMTVIEAMSYGIPVVTTDISTMGELLGENIPRIPVGDAEKLAEEIRRYYEDANLREETSQFLYERAKSHFNIERNVKQLLGIYDRILNKNDC